MNTTPRPLFPVLGIVGGAALSMAPCSAVHLIAQSTVDHGWGSWFNAAILVALAGAVGGAMLGTLFAFQPNRT